MGVFFGVQAVANEGRVPPSPYGADGALVHPNCVRNEQHTSNIRLVARTGSTPWLPVTPIVAVFDQRSE